MHGETDNVANFIENSDVVIAIGRCILEAIAMKRISIISGNDSLKGVIEKNNIKDAIDSNFNGRASMKSNKEHIEEMKTLTAEEIIDSLDKIENNNLEEIIEYNYNEILNKLDIRKNSYCITNEVNTDYEVLYFRFLDIINDRINKEIEISQFKDIIDEEKKKIEKKNYEINQLRSEIDLLKENIYEKQNLIDSIYGSRRWRLTSKIIDPLKNVKSKIERKNNAK